FAYDGWAHSGLAWQPPTAKTPFTTVEAEILQALLVSRLIEPIKDKENDGFGCGFERCGRTDAGVSSSGQVINLWVRSDLEDPMGTGAGKAPAECEMIEACGAITQVDKRSGEEDRPASPTGSATSSLESTKSENIIRRKPASSVEIPYVTILNKHLPPTVRILAWSPVSPTFSSRYSCIWRHYKYFFSTSPSAPFLSSRFDFGSAYADADQTAEWQRRLAQADFKQLELDVDLMRDALRRLVGEHDFRNLCKVDAPKQLTTHVRTVISASIDRVAGEGEDMFVLNLRGGAFLYNQVRHIVALLFLVGARLETPDVVDRLLWTSDRTPSTEALQATTRPDEPPASREVMDGKPGYSMADDLPLILWECGFNGTELNWRVDNAPLHSDSSSDVKVNTSGLHAAAKMASDPVESFRRHFLEMNENWTHQRLKALIGKHHLSSLASHAPVHPPRSETPSPLPTRPPSPSPSNKKRPGVPRSSPVVFTPHGAGLYTKTISYIPVLKKVRNDPPDVQNARWAAGRGAARMEKRVQNKAKSDADRIRNLAVKAEAQRLSKESEGKAAEGHAMESG
ncbi:tRNA pseudouridine38/39 synthase, partial [Phenoliferia sp. Uapishka_3]